MTPPARGFSVSWFGDRCLRIALRSPDAHGPDPGALALEACDRLLAAGVPNLIDVAPAASSALLIFDPHALDATGSERAVTEALCAEATAPMPAAPTVVEIPVCYEAPFAPDLSALATERGATPADFARAHAEAAYRADFLGFMPGFAYLSGLPVALHAPRLPRPRTSVPAGSVGIADDKTGIYPAASPGGWRLIGRTPLRMFDAARPRPSILHAGDRVRFRAITPAEFTALAGEAG